MFKEKKTKVSIENFKGNRMFAVWEVDEDDSPVSDYPVVSFGKTKAKAILKHLEELEEFVDE